ncbi:glycosyltransferase [Methylobacterium sp. J-059]|uniref:glycosyltransferase family 2 protein n=1 Tax=Methylobacterium sp. J-059 TaxID=2836643 RepID=UPI001FBB1971|nr:glycosyltransferase [Methylobacterium sp. J-059]MCJ2039277.1 glycosyltransferase [Methylobacterium sp. J-059]
MRAALAAQIRAEPLLVGGGPGATLAGLADGTVFIVIGSGVRLRPQASYVFARALEHFRMLAASSDNDRIDDAGVYGHPVFKPAMAPDLMARLPYAGPVVALALTVETRACPTQAFRTADPSAARARLLLGPPATRVMRVLMPLYSLLDRAVSEDGEEVVYESVAALGLPASTPHPNSSTEKTWPPVRIVIPTPDRPEFLEACLDSLFEHPTCPRERMRLVMVDNDSTDAAALASLDAFAARPCCAVVSSPGPSNFAKICNDGAAWSEGEILVFLNNHTMILQPDWLDKLAHQAARHEIGLVGAQLHYPDRTVQHGGVILEIEGVGGHRLVGFKADRAVQRDVTREMIAVTGACLVIRAAVFEELGGFDERLGVAFNDTALFVRAHEADYRNLYIAEPLLIQHKSKSRGFDDSSHKLARQRREATYVRERYGAVPRRSLLLPQPVAVERPPPCGPAAGRTSVAAVKAKRAQAADHVVRSWDRVRRRRGGGAAGRVPRLLRRGGHRRRPDHSSGPSLLGMPPGRDLDLNGRGRARRRVHHRAYATLLLSEALPRLRTHN